MAEKPAWETYLEDNRQEHLDQLFDLLRIPSISALPEHKGDIQKAAEWVADKMKAAGVPKVEVMPTDGNPVVFGEWQVDESKPTVLIYGHYDVQPPDPLDLWTTPAFEPAIRDGAIFARGAADDKGNLFQPIRAVEALNETQGGPPINVKFIIEGEEEVGSPNLPPFVANNKDLLACDFVICADGGMYSEETPSLTLGSKGICGLQIDLRTADTDMHSGMFGSNIQNAARAAAQLAATFHDEQHRVAVDGFYQDVRDLTDDDKAEYAELPFDEGEYLGDVGASELVGEEGYTALERAGGRPTLDINGIWGGFQGAGTKTVTPCEAHIKITCRLVADQDPAQIIEALKAHVEKHKPAGTEISFSETTGGARAFRIEREHPAIETAFQVLGDLYDRDPYFVRLGGTLPIAASFQDDLGADMLFYSWGLPGSRAHAPNENFKLSAFDMAPRAHAALLVKLGE